VRPVGGFGRSFKLISVVPVVWYQGKSFSAYAGSGTLVIVDSGGAPPSGRDVLARFGDLARFRRILFEPLEGFCCSFKLIFSGARCMYQVSLSTLSLAPALYVVSYCSRSGFISSRLSALYSPRNHPFISAICIRCRDKFAQSLDFSFDADGRSIVSACADSDKTTAMVRLFIRFSPGAPLDIDYDGAATKPCPSIL